MKHGALFAGIGGFELGGMQHGIHPAWSSEIEAFPRKLLAERFPQAVHYGSVTDIDFTKVEPVDVLTAGSPCQDFSIAGHRSGLEGERSGLFSHFTRAIDTLEQRGLKYAIWENVLGSLSSKKGRDFHNVLAALVGADQPIALPAAGGRSSRYAGLAVGPRRAVAWRVLDASGLGVAQRRRRVLAVTAFGRGAAERAVEVLLEPEGCARDSLPRGEALAHTAAAVGRGAACDCPAGPYGAPVGCVAGEGRTAFDSRSGERLEATNTLDARARNGPMRNQGGPIVVEHDPRPYDEVARCLTAHHAPRYDYDTESFVPVLMRQREGKPGGGKGPLLTEDMPLTLATSNDQYLFEPFVYDRLQVTSPKHRSRYEPGRLCPTLHTQPMDLVQGFNATQEPLDYGDLAGPLTCGAQYEAGVRVEYRVRRLTPHECELLQGFPPGWTALEGAKDSHRYKALGNAVAVPVARWLMQRIAAVEQGHRHAPEAWEVDA